MNVTRVEDRTSGNRLNAEKTCNKCREYGHIAKACQKESDSESAESEPPKKTGQDKKHKHTRTGGALASTGIAGATILDTIKEAVVNC